jgi:Putative antitoxin of bacterial toxin-antitoxin system, YdaS/YdaT
MQLKQWLDEERGRALALAKAIKVPPSFVSNMGSGAKQVPFDQCMPIERATDGAVTRRDLRPDDYLIHWPELAEPQPPPAPAATDLIAIVQAAITQTKDAVVQAAGDELHQVKTDIKVELKHSAVEALSGLEAAQRAAVARAGKSALPWDGVERREGGERRNPDVLESPAAADGQGV